MSNCLGNELWAGLDQLDAERKTVGRPCAILLAQAQEHDRPSNVTDQIYVKCRLDLASIPLDTTVLWFAKHCCNCYHTCGDTAW